MIKSVKKEREFWLRGCFFVKKVRKHVFVLRRKVEKVRNLFPVLLINTTEKGSYNVQKIF